MPGSFRLARACKKLGLCIKTGKTKIFRAGGQEPPPRSVPVCGMRRAPLSPAFVFGEARQARLTVVRRLKSRRFLDKETAFPEIVDFPRGNVVYFKRGIISDI